LPVNLLFVNGRWRRPMAQRRDRPCPDDMREPWPRDCRMTPLGGCDGGMLTFGDKRQRSVPESARHPARPPGRGCLLTDPWPRSRAWRMRAKAAREWLPPWLGPFGRTTRIPSQNRECF
jgi:hypothetical protein